MYGSQHELGFIDSISPLIAMIIFLLGIVTFTLTVVKFIYSKNETTKLVRF